MAIYRWMLVLICLPILTGAIPNSAAASPEGINFVRTVVDNHLYQSFTSMAIDSNGLPQVAYQKQSGPGSFSSVLYYARWTGSAWSFQEVGESELGGDVNIALDSGNKPHISYSACNPFSCLPRFADWTGSQWVVDAAVEGEGPLVFDTADQPHMVYSYGNVQGSISLKYAYRAGSQWHAATLLSNLRDFPPRSIAVDTQNHPRLTYYARGALTYAAWSGSAWTTSAVEGRSNVGYAVSLKLDRADQPHLSYYDWNTGDLRYASRTGASWSSETVDSAGDVGQISAIAVDHSGSPHIAYYDATLKAIKYGRRVSGHWQIVIIASNVDQPAKISLGLNNLDLPLIAYASWDSTTKDTSLILARGQPAQTLYLPAVFKL